MRNLLISLVVLSFVGSTGLIEPAFSAKEKSASAMKSKRKASLKKKKSMRVAKKKKKRSMKKVPAARAMPKAAKRKVGQKVGRLKTLTGELISIPCLVQSSRSRTKNRRCFEKTIERGLPLAIMTSTGKIYQVTVGGKVKLQDLYKRIKRFGTKKVTAVGRVYSRNGINLIRLKKIRRRG